MTTLLNPHDPSFLTYDFEFLDDGRAIELVSGGFVSGDGRRLYFINREMPQEKILMHDWMRKNVWPHLPLKDLPERTGSIGQYVKKPCSCQPVNPEANVSNHEYTCFHMNGRLDMDHPDVRPMGQIRRLVGDFILEAHPHNPIDDEFHRDDVKMWAWYGAYDHVRLAQIWGPMIDLPPYVPMLTHDLKSEAMRLGNPQMPRQAGKEHNALEDALGNHEKAKFLWQIATGNNPLPDGHPR